MEHRTSPAQRKAQQNYNTRQKEAGYYQTRPWIPEEMRDWHEVFVRRCREWKEYGVKLELPPLPPETQ